MHRVLERQIRRYVGELDASNLPLVSLLEAVSDTYRHFDQDRDLLDRTLELSSREFTKLNIALQSEKGLVEQKVQERTEELERERVKLDEIAQNMDIGAILMDSQGDVIFVNREAKEILHNPEQRETLEAFKKIFSEAEIEDAIKKCLVGNPSTIQESKAENKIYELRFRCLYSSDGSAFGHIVWLQNITRSKLLERSQRDFISIASHELRTPLTIIRGNAELLGEALIKEPNGAELFTMVTPILNGAIRLLTIVNDFLDIAALEEEHVKFERKPFDLTKVVEDVVKEVKEKVERKKIFITMREGSPLRVLADAERARGILINLFSNAIQYTEQGGITISINKESGFAKVYIADTGIGIKPEFHSSLFQRFQTIGERFIRSKEYGSGMGLYVSKLMAEKMGGAIKLEESVPGKGSVFSFALPLETTAAVPKN